MSPAEFEQVESALVAAGVPACFVIPVALLAEQLQAWSAARAGVDPAPPLLGAMVDEMLGLVGVDPGRAVVGDLLRLACLVRRPAGKSGRGAVAA